MRCTCPASEWAHHHVHGGAYPCEGFSECRHCQAADERLWSDEGLTESLASNPGFDRIRRKYGAQTARHGRNNPPED
jgi:hypothetical protein